MGKTPSKRGDMVSTPPFEEEDEKGYTWRLSVGIQVSGAKPHDKQAQMTT
jgi:hypothetical protein